MSDEGKSYRRRPADDGGEYLLMPRDDDGLPLPPGEPVHIDWPMEDQPNHTPPVAISAEVESAVEAFFASIGKSTPIRPVSKNRDPES